MREEVTARVGVGVGEVNAQLLQAGCAHDILCTLKLCRKHRRPFKPFRNAFNCSNIHQCSHLETSFGTFKKKTKKKKQGSNRRETKKENKIRKSFPPNTGDFECILLAFDKKRGLFLSIKVIRLTAPCSLNAHVMCVQRLQKAETHSPISQTDAGQLFRRSDDSPANHPINTVQYANYAPSSATPTAVGFFFVPHQVRLMFLFIH